MRALADSRLLLR